MNIENNSNRWLRSAPSINGINVVCVPYAGGDGFCFRSLQERTCGLVNIHPVFPPGHMSRLKEESPQSMDSYILGLLPSLSSFFNSPYVLLGSSMGAWVCFELCQYLSNRGFPLPKALIICAAASPQDKKETFRFSGLGRNEIIKELASMKPDFARALNNSELADLIIPILVADLDLCIEWNPTLAGGGSKLPVPVYAFYGVEDTVAPCSTMLHWENITDKEFGLWGVEGGHFFVDNPPEDFIFKVIEICKNIDDSVS